MPLPLCKFAVIPRRLIDKLTSCILFSKTFRLFSFWGFVWNGKVQFSLGIESVLGF